MKVKNLSEILKENPEFNPEWKFQGDMIANQKFGSSRHIVICDDKGEPLYDTIEIRETPGVIILPYYQDKGVFYLGIVRQKRPIIEDPKTKSQGNVLSIEFPRGFALKGEPTEEAVRRELSEETGSMVKKLFYLGSINPLTSLYAEQKANEVFAAEVDSKVSEKRDKSLSKEAQKEGISSSQYLPLNEIFTFIKKGEMFCGLSQAALLKFLIHHNISIK